MKRISVRGILRDQFNRICLIHRIKNGKEYWVIPGGGQEGDESNEDTLRRELIEEVGSVIDNISQEPVITYCTDDSMQYFYTCSEVSRTKPTGLEHTKSNPNDYYEVMFVEVDKLESLQLVPTPIKGNIIAAAHASLAPRA